eukprot:scaffold102543_cov36-Tisochrysis_lutea.AAC.1
MHVAEMDDGGGGHHSFANRIRLGLRVRCPRQKIPHQTRPGAVCPSKLNVRCKCVSTSPRTHPQSIKVATSEAGRRVPTYESANTLWQNHTPRNNTTICSHKSRLPMC